jgi:formiminotetrahydrofolate cyclodeaminase
VNDEVPDCLGLPLGRFLELVASEAPAPAGGSVAEISARLAREGNPNLEGDAISAALLAEAEVSAAARLAKINLTRAGIGNKRLAHADVLVESAASAGRAAQEGRIDAPRNL